MRLAVILLLSACVAQAQFGRFGDVAFTSSTSPLLQSLNYYYRLEEASGNRPDYTHYDNTLSSSNSVGQTTGIQGNGALFARASSRFLQAPNAVSVQTGDIDFSIVSWVKLTANGAGFNYSYVTKINATAGNSEYGQIFRASNQRHSFFVYKPTDTLAKVDATTFGLPPIGTFQMVAGWHNAAADTVNISINAGPIDSAATGGALQAAGTAPLTVGSLSGANFMDGTLDEMGLWKRVLSTNEIGRLYNFGSGTHFPRFDALPVVIDTSWTTNLISAAGDTNGGVHAWQQAGIIEGSGKLFAAFYNANGTNYSAEFTNSTATWSTPVVLGSGHGGDSAHNWASMAVDTNGYIHAFYGAHDTTLYYRRSSNTNSALSWGGESNVASIATYPAALVDRNNKLLVFYRSGPGGGNTASKLDLITSTDSGTNWSAATHIIDTSDANFWVYHGGIGQGREATNSLHLMWGYRYAGADNPTLFTNIFYAKSLDSGATWLKSDGSTYTLPITPATGELIYNSQSVLSSFVAVDTNGYPSLGFIKAHGTDYWTNSLGMLSTFNGSSWTTRTIPGDNYDHHILPYISSNNVFRVLGIRPSTGGGLNLWNMTSTDSGATWTGLPTKLVTFPLIKACAMPSLAGQTLMAAMMVDTNGNVMSATKAIQ